MQNQLGCYVAIFKDKVTVKAYKYNQNITVFALSFDLMILLQPNLIL